MKSASEVIMKSEQQNSTHAAKLLFNMLERLEHGGLTVITPDEREYHFGDTSPIRWEIRDWRVFDEILVHSDIGLGEAYIEGRWECNDIPGLIALAARNRGALQRVVSGNLFAMLRHRLRHWLHSNHKRGSKRNIMAHYDLGNHFYRTWLDDSMTYSAALFNGDPQQGLRDAQSRKYRRILGHLERGAGERVLEIGCGWGGFACEAAQQGYQLHGVTLSPSQLDFAQQRITKLDVEQKPQLSLTDYRDIRGRYDHIVSIEMFEAVGERYWKTYFGALKNLLGKTGQAMIQTITIRDDLFDGYRRGSDFIQQHVFPGGMLPSPAQFKRHAGRAGLQVTDAHAFGHDYAETLKRWRAQFTASWRDIQPLGFDERFFRLWTFYLAYCEGGFLGQSTDVYQFKLEHA